MVRVFLVLNEKLFFSILGVLGVLECCGFLGVFFNFMERYKLLNFLEVYVCIC